MNYLPIDIASIQSDLLAVRRRVKQSMDDDEDRAFAMDALDSVLERLESIGIELQTNRVKDVQATIENQNGSLDIILPVPLPKSIDGTRQRQLMHRALKGGLISPTANGYKVVRMSGRQEAYLCKCIFTVDPYPFPAKHVEKLFQTHNLSATISRLSDNPGAKPRGWQRIDNALVG